MELTKKDQAFMDAIEASTPEGYTLVCGWPDASHGIHHEAYRDWIANVANNLDEGEDMPPVLAYKAWVECQRGNNEDRDNLGFSWENCELCGSLPGDRHAVSAIQPGTDTSVYIYEVCGDCLMYVANGDLPND